MKERIKKLYWKVVTTRLDGINIIEIILILVIIIGLVLIFRTQITELVSNAFTSITTGSGEINNPITIEGN